MNYRDMVGKKYVVRTRYAGVHIGTLVEIDEANPEVCRLQGCTRLWRWEGSLSLSGVAESGITGGRLQRHNEVVITGAIEYLPLSDKAESTLKDALYE